MELFLLYLVLQLDSIRFTLEAFLFIWIGGMFISGIIRTESRSKWPTRFVVLFLLAFLGTAVLRGLIPSTKSGAVLAGAYAIKEVSQTETAQRMAGKSVKLIEDWLETLEPPKKKEK